jgi:hypothetical protein
LGPARRKVEGEGNDEMDQVKKSRVQFALVFFWKNHTVVIKSDL